MLCSLVYVPVAGSCCGPLLDSEIIEIFPHEWHSVVNVLWGKRLSSKHPSPGHWRHAFRIASHACSPLFSGVLSGAHTYPDAHRSPPVKFSSSNLWRMLPLFVSTDAASIAHQQSHRLSHSGIALDIALHSMCRNIASPIGLVGINLWCPPCVEWSIE